MERNDNLGNLGDATGAGQGGTTGGSTAGGTGGYGGTSDVGGGTSSGFGATGGTGGSATGGYGSTGADAGASGIGDRARDAASTARDKVSDVGSTVRDRAGQAKNSLADALEAGADRLRSRGGSQQLAGSTGYSDTSVGSDGGGRVADLGQRVAGGLQSSADWLREADLDNLRSGVERQVKENPGRTLLIAVGLGYLLGKAFRR